MSKIYRLAILAVAIININSLGKTLEDKCSANSNLQSVQKISAIITENVKLLNAEQASLQNLLLKEAKSGRHPFLHLWYGENVFELFRACAHNSKTCKNLTKEELDNAPSDFSQLAQRINALVLLQEQWKKIRLQVEAQKEQ